jgi:hypothetical protein
MRHSRNATILAVSIAALAANAAFADVRTEQKSRVEFGGVLGRMMNMFGGKSAREGVVSTVAVKGNRKATLNEDTGQIVDLGEEKVYDLDLKRKTYKVTTFAELRRRMEEARKKAEQDARKEQPKEETSKREEQPQVEIDFDIKNTGQKKMVNGFDTHEAVMTITVRERGKTLEQGGGMVVTSDMWLAPKIAAMREIADFDMRYAQKLYGTTVSGVSAEQMAAALAMYPMMKEALGRMSAEGAKLEGTPILTTTTMDAAKSAEQMAADGQQKESDSKPGVSGGVGGLLGGLARRAAAKKAEGDADAKPRATFMTSTTEVMKVVSDVSADDVAVPAGFKENK